MAFNKKSLALVASVPTISNKIWKSFSYASPDAAAIVSGAGYFPDTAPMAINDVIDCMCVHDGVGDRVSVKVTGASGGFFTTAVNVDAVGT